MPCFGERSCGISLSEMKSPITNHQSPITNNSGFTLIELLITIALISILSVLGFSSYKATRKRGKDAKRKSDLNQIKMALRMYYNDNQGYPNNNINGLIEACGDATFNWGDEFSCGGTVYMKKLPEDPAGRPYFYEQQSGGDEGFNLYACLDNLGDQSGTACHSAMTCVSNTCCFKVSEE